MLILAGLIYLTNLIFGIDGDTRYWIRNTNVLNKDNWAKDATDCKGLVFPTTIHNSMLLDNLTMKQIIFPLDGELYINNNAKLVLDEKSETCIKLKPLKKQNILDPKNWNHLPNKAIPDTHRIPCAFDDVIIPTNSTFDRATFDDIWLIKRIMHGQALKETTLMVNSVHYDNGAKFNSWNHFFITLQPYQCKDPKRYNCKCRFDLDDSIYYDVCATVEEYKRDMDVCENPFSVIEFFCTKICGAYITFKNSPDVLNTIIHLLEEYSDYVDYYITADYLLISHHLFILDKNTDDGFYSVGLAKQVEAILKSENVPIMEIVTSGKPAKTGKILQMAFGMLLGAFLVTVVFFLIIFTVYVGFPRKYSFKLKWLPTTDYSFRPFNFARFENRGEGGLSFDRSMASSVVSLEKSFHNPLYGAIPSTSKDFVDESGESAAESPEDGEEMKELDEPLMIIEDLNEEEED